MRRSLELTGAALIVGFACSMVAAVHPALSSVWTAHGERALTVIGHHRSAGNSSTWMFAVGIGFTLTGLAVFTDLLRVTRPTPPCHRRR